ncbi:MAG: GNAT family N-acetyltransferase [Eubacteriales bacterium]|nr:GNAT family N-acetyltransferase [Eubacteriales bacterium]
MEDEFVIRFASLSDAEGILAVYAPFITDTCISFETEIPSVESFRERMRGIMTAYPYLVCEKSGVIVGYAYASKYSERAAYRYSADVSIYIAPEYHRKGIGKQLYTTLLEILKERGFYTVFACIAGKNKKSEDFHYSFGFVKVGEFHNAGFKHGRWHNIIWMEKPLREYTNPEDAL